MYRALPRLTLCLALLVACGGGSVEGSHKATGGMMGGRGMPMMGGAVADTATAPRPDVVEAGPANECPAITASAIALGRRTFAGPGNCYSCHGADARGTAAAPDLTDREWLNIDGSYGAIAGLIRRGVPTPARFPAPMPARGGADLDSLQVCGLAAYLYSVSARP